MNKNQSITLDSQQAQEILQLIGVMGAVTVVEIREHNHVWRFDCEAKSYFLKIFTKEWYGDPFDPYPVMHEKGAFDCLSVHQVPAACVPLAQSNANNLLGRPFLLTEKVPGKDLLILLEASDEKTRNNLLGVTGKYLRKLHDVVFEYAGFVDDPSGPAGPLDEGGYIHEVWSVKQLQTNALANLHREKGLLSTDLADRLEEKYLMIIDLLGEFYYPPRFAMTNAQIDHLFLVEQDGTWEVSGCIDMEAASAGNSMYDIAYLMSQIAATCPNTSYWWRSFFSGYGVEPTFEQFQLQMLAIHEHNFHFGRGWLGSRAEILERILLANNWFELFNARGVN